MRRPRWRSRPLPRPPGTPAGTRRRRLQRRAVDGAEPGGRVGQRWPTISETTRANRWIPDPPARRRLVAASRRRSGADDHVGPAASRRLEDSDLAGVVLPVAVDLDGHVEAVLERVPVAGLHCAADAEVVRQAHDLRAVARPRRAVASVEPSSTTTTSKPGAAAGSRRRPPRPTPPRCTRARLPAGARRCGSQPQRAIRGMLPAGLDQARRLSRSFTLPRPSNQLITSSLPMALLPRRIGAPVEHARVFVLRPFRGPLEASIVWAFHRLYYSYGSRTLLQHLLAGTHT